MNSLHLKLISVSLATTAYYVLLVVCSIIDNGVQLILLSCPSRTCRVSSSGREGGGEDSPSKKQLLWVTSIGKLMQQLQLPPQQNFSG